jgi:hypothetical protein
LAGGGTFMRRLWRQQYHQLRLHWRSGCLFILSMSLFVAALVRETFQPGVTAPTIYAHLFNSQLFSTIYLPLCLMAGLSFFDYRLLDYGRVGRKRVWFWQLLSQNLIMQGTLWGLWTGSLLWRSYFVGHWAAVKVVLWGCLQLGMHQGFFATLSLILYWSLRKKAVAMLGIWLLEVVSLDLLQQPASPFFKYTYLAPFGSHWVAALVVCLGWGVALIGLRWLIDWRDS